MNEASLWVGKYPKEAAGIAITKKYTGGDIETNAKLLADYQFITDINQAKESLLHHFRNLKEQGIFDPSTDPDALLKEVFVALK